MRTRSIYDPQIGEHFEDKEIPENDFVLELYGVDDNLLLFVRQSDTGGFKFYMGEFYGLAQNLALPPEEREDPNYQSLRISSEGWASFDGLRHITTYWNYIDWDLQERYYRIMRQLEKQLTRDFAGELSEDKFEETIMGLGFVKYKHWEEK